MNKEYVATEVLVSERLDLLGQHIIGTINKEADISKFLQKTLVINMLHKMHIDLISSEYITVGLDVIDLRHGRITITVINLQ